MAVFVKLKDSDRLKLFYQLREKTNLSFNKLPLLLGISRPSFFNYYSKGLPIPLEIFKKLIKISGINNINIQSINKERFLRNNPKLPKLNESFAEIIGALNGDGHISKHNYEVNIVSDKREKDYHKHLKDLFRANFKIVPSSSNLKGNTIKLRIYSIDIFNELIHEYKLPLGKKKGKLKIPIQIKSSKTFLISYLRGLYDTDGSFYLRRNNEPVVQITSASPVFLKEIREALASLNFRVSQGNQRIFIYPKKDVRRFFETIKPANSKHLKKYQNYLKL